MAFINTLYRRFYRFFSGRFPKTFLYLDSRKSIIKFIIAGSFAGGTDLVALFIFHGVFKWEIVFSTSAAFLLAFLVSFTLQKFWTFRNNYRSRIFRQLLLYMLTAFIGLNINGVAMHFLVNSLSVWYILAQIIVNLFLGVLNFLIYKFIIFRKR